jgi:hypothetical protein
MAIVELSIGVLAAMYQNDYDILTFAKYRLHLPGKDNIADIFPKEITCDEHFQ